MKHLKYLTIFLLFSCESKTEAEADSHKSPPLVETVIADLDGDKLPDTIRMSHEPEHDPGEYRELTIAFSALGHFQEKAVEVWDSVPGAFARQHRNAVQSDRLFVSKRDDATFIMLFGYPYPTGRCELAVISISDRKAQLQRITQFVEAETLTDLDGNGTTELIGRNQFEILESSDSLKADIGTYSPFYVLSYVKNDGTFQLDPKLTEQYNKEHYVWKGMQYDEQIHVLYPRNGEKPQLRD